MVCPHCSTLAPDGVPGRSLVLCPSCRRALEPPALGEDTEPTPDGEPSDPALEEAQLVAELVDLVRAAPDREAALEAVHERLRSAIRKIT